MSGGRSTGGSPDVLVVGGGIVGLATARELAGEGLSVEVVERGQPGREASAAAAGMLAPLAEVPEPGPLFDACRRSRDLWGDWVAELEEEAGQPVEYDASGTLAVAMDEEEVAALAGLERSAGELGEVVRELPLEEARRRVPHLAPDLLRVLELPGDHRVNNVDACEALVLAGQRRGVTLHNSTALERVEVVDGAVRATLRDAAGTWQQEAATLVLAAGAWSGRIPGLPALPVRPVRGQMLSLGDVHWPWPGVVRAGHRYAVRRAAANAVPRRDPRSGLTTLIVGATVEDAGFEVANTPEGLADLVAFVQRRFPGLARNPVRSIWAGLRPGTPDELPVLGPLPGMDRALVATGHHRNGILLAPWSAQRVAALVTGRETAAPDDPFSPARFGPALLAAAGTASVVEGSAAEGEDGA